MSSFGDPPLQMNKDTLDLIIVEIKSNIRRLFSALQRTPPSGTILMFGAAAAPNGYLLCNGAAVSRADYADLFAVIGVLHGIGDGSTTFNVPDFTANFPRGNTPAANGGLATHTHVLSDNGQAQIAIAAPSSILERRITTANWTSTHSSTATAGAGGTVAGAGAALTGATDSAGTLPPYVGVAFIIKI